MNRKESSDEIEGDEEPQTDSDGSSSSSGDDVPQLKRSTCVRKSIQKLCLPLHHVFYKDVGKPEYFEEALHNGFHLKWVQVMDDEISSLEQNHTWELVQPLIKEKILQNKWIYKLKYEVNETKRFKARLMVKGYDQKKALILMRFFPQL